MIWALLLSFIAIAQALVFPVGLSRYLSSILLVASIFFAHGKFGSLVGDDFTRLGMLAIAIPAVITLMFHKKPQRHFVLLVTILTLSGYLVAASRNLATLAISLEAMSLTAAAVAFYPGAKEKIKVVVTYLIFSVFAAAMLFLGLAFYFAGSHTTDLVHFTQTSTAIVGIVLMLASIMVKLAISPMHTWAVDVYSESSTSASIYLSSAVKVGAMLALAILSVGPLRLAYSVSYWQILIPALLLAALSNIVGAAGMVTTNKMKRMLSFSSIAHAGFVALALAYPGQLSAAVIAYYALVYSIANTIAFSSVLLVKGEGESEIMDLKVLYKRPLTALAVAIAALSLLGIPPTAGFSAKLMALINLFNAKSLPPALLIGVAVVSLVFTAASGYGYIKIVAAVTKKPEKDQVISLPSLEMLLWVLAAMLIILYFYPLWPVPTLG
ncbi:hypothetical protein IPA_04710 [Ignicoccus pacificus DSM 13166]|uniref:NADH:quinone oxidoreductase/Mrp antiporter transmembrane domain-containing protein n=1 Tax=Ignicoccus pacificus DSM 13166 TaxID=940294 RepID=A0A977KB57_9CREN|nr:hypothetical protein IPA_04710 [Ignicoccus pacificus DSM 13166]